MTTALLINSAARSVTEIEINLYQRGSIARALGDPAMMIASHTNWLVRDTRDVLYVDDNGWFRGHDTAFWFHDDIPVAGNGLIVGAEKLFDGELVGFENVSLSAMHIVGVLEFLDRSGLRNWMGVHGSFPAVRIGGEVLSTWRDVLTNCGY